MTKIEKTNREKEISARIVARLKTGITIDQALSSLNVQELAAVWLAAQEELKNINKKEAAYKNLLDGANKIQELVIDRLATMQKIYVLFTKYSHMPYYMTNGYVCLFSEKEYATEFSDICEKSLRSVHIQRVEKKHIQVFFSQLFKLYGVKGAVIDPGQNCLVYTADRFIRHMSNLTREQLIPSAPDLVRAAAMLQQESNYSGVYTGKEELLRQMRIETLAGLKKARFIIPFKPGKKTDYPEVVKPGTKSPLAVPIFTDMDQFDIFYNRTFPRTIVSISELIKYPPQLYTINPGTIWFTVDKRTLKKLC